MKGFRPAGKSDLAVPLLKASRSDAIIYFPASTPQASPSQLFWQSISPVALHPLTCPGCISQAETHTSAELSDTAQTALLLVAVPVHTLEKDLRVAMRSGCGCWYERMMEL